MAHVRILSTVPHFQRIRGHVRQSSDDLIQDLERHLGSTSTEYLQVRMAYRHSGFPHGAHSSHPITAASTPVTKNPGRRRRRRP